MGWPSAQSGVPDPALGLNKSPQDNDNSATGATGQTTVGDEMHDDQQTVTAQAKRRHATSPASLSQKPSAKKTKPADPINDDPSDGDYIDNAKPPAFESSARTSNSRARRHPAQTAVAGPATTSRAVATKSGKFSWGHDSK